MNEISCDRIIDAVQVLDGMGHRVSEDWERRHVWLSGGCLEDAYIHGSLQTSNQGNQEPL